MNKHDKRPNGSQETIITGTETIITGTETMVSSTESIISGIDTNKQLFRSIDKI